MICRMSKGPRSGTAAVMVADEWRFPGVALFGTGFGASVYARTRQAWRTLSAASTRTGRTEGLD